MKIWSAILTAIGELLGHKLRSLLTMFGVIFGIASVIAMVSIGAGGRQEALELIRLMGVNVIQVSRKSLAGDLAREAERDSPNGLTYGDALALKKLYSAARMVVPVCRVFGDARVADKAVPSKIYGTTPDYPEVSRFRVVAGRFLDAHDVNDRSPVCVIGSDVKRAAFFLEDPIGKALRIGGRDFRVIGVMQERAAQAGRSRFSLRDMNQDVYLPITVAMEDFQIYVERAIPMSPEAIMGIVSQLFQRPALNLRPISEVAVEVNDPDKTVPAAQVVKQILDRRHNHIPDFEIVIPLQLLQQRQQTQNIFNIVMGAIAGISLVVGGIGIMNIMLATVTQRAREIGIRRCIGATRGDIVRQFLLECLVITTIGGLVGVGGGIGGARAISYYAQWKTVVSGSAVVLSLAVSFSVGLIFGLYPAIRAALIDPMEALRSE